MFRSRTVQAPPHNIPSQRLTLRERIFFSKSRRADVLAERIIGSRIANLADAMAVKKCAEIHLKKAKKLDTGDYAPTKSLQFLKYDQMVSEYETALRLFEKAETWLKGLGQGEILLVVRAEIYRIREKLEQIDGVSESVEFHESDISEWEK